MSIESRGKFLILIFKKNRIPNLYTLMQLNLDFCIGIIRKLTRKSSNACYHFKWALMLEGKMNMKIVVIIFVLVFGTISGVEANNGKGKKTTDYILSYRQFQKLPSPEKIEYLRFVAMVLARMESRQTMEKGYSFSIPDFILEMFLSSAFAGEGGGIAKLEDMLMPKGLVLKINRKLENQKMRMSQRRHKVNPYPLRDQRSGQRMSVRPAMLGTLHPPQRLNKA